MNEIKTLHELAKENPDKTYKELEKIKEGVCVTAALKKDIEGPTVFDEERKKFKKEIDYHRYWKDMYEKEHKLRQEAQGETTIVKGIGMSSPEMKDAKARIKELENSLSIALEINENQQRWVSKVEDKLKSRDYTRQHDYKFLVDENKKLHKEIDELRRDNKMLTHQVDDQIARARKAGL